MDTKGLLNPASERSQYIIVIVEPICNYIVTVPFAEKNAHFAKNAKIHIWISKFGPPQGLITDRGNEYPNSQPANCCPLFIVRQYPRISHAPWTNGPIEVQKKNRGAHLRMFLIEDPADCSKSVQFFAYAHNTQLLSHLHYGAKETVFHTQPSFPMKSQIDLSRN